MNSASNCGDDGETNAIGARDHFAAGEGGGGRVGIGW